MLGRLGVLTLLVVGLAALLGGCASPGTALLPYAVQARTVQGAGQVLFDGSGYALYIYVPDDRGPSRCVGVCAKAWPPLVLPAHVRRPGAGESVQAVLLGTRKRENGTLQVTYDGWPLYRYIDDVRGTVLGQAEGMGAWYLITPSGKVDKLPVAGS